MIELCRQNALQRSLEPTLYVQAIETLDLPVRVEIGANVVGDPSVLNRSRSYTWNRGREGTDSFGIGF